jgi:hypothetical protein
MPGLFLFIFSLHHFIAEPQQHPSFFFFYGPPACGTGRYRFGLWGGPLTMGPELRKEIDYSAVYTY